MIQDPKDVILPAKLYGSIEARRAAFLAANRRNAQLSNVTPDQRHKVIYSLDDAKRANENAGLHWFDPDTLRWFSSRILEGTFIVVSDGTLFVSSERNTMSDWPREYTVRFIHSHGERRGRIETIGTFQQFASRSGAVSALKRYAANWSGITYAKEMWSA